VEEVEEEVPPGMRPTARQDITAEKEELVDFAKKLLMFPQYLLSLLPSAQVEVEEIGHMDQTMTVRQELQAALLPLAHMLLQTVAPEGAEGNQDVEEQEELVQLAM
jgi:hypothetical protein